MKELDELVSELPDHADIAEKQYEGSNIVFYTQSKDFFLNNEQTVRSLVSQIRKRVEIRPSPHITKAQSTAEQKITAIVPDEAELEEIIFQQEFGRVILRAKKPGLVIGKNGETLEKIKEETLWMPLIQRVPAIDSKVVAKAREWSLEDAQYRKKFLNEIGKKIRLNKSTGGDWVRLTSLGGYQEVGRSGSLLQTQTSNVLIDCGVGFGNSQYPYLNVPEFDLNRLDAVIITHAHSDHCCFLPYLYEYGYDGPVYLTEPTRDFMILLQLDMLELLKREGKKTPYSSKSIKEAVKRSIPVSMGEVTDITPDMRLTFNNAGHILGSASAHIHIGEGFHNIVHTGDIRYGKSSILDPANPNFNRVETLVMDSTYGNNTQRKPPKHEADKHFLNMVRETIEKRQGKVIIPSFAVGRAQEAMVVLNRIREELNVPIYLDGMIWDANALHTAYPEYMSKNMQKKIFHYGENPFLAEHFKRVGSVQERQQVIEQHDPCIILTTSGMINGGPIMHYLEELGPNPDNRLIFIGYQAANTLGRKIKQGLREIPASDPNNTTRLELDVKTVEGFQGHSDRQQTLNFISKLPNKPKKVICQHGDENATFALASTIHKVFKTETQAPKNLETVRLV